MTGAPYGAESRTYFPANNQGGSRTPAAISYAVVHCTGSDNTDEDTGAWFHAHVGPGVAQGSTQCGTDDDSLQRFMDDTRIPAGAPPLNDHGVHIEIAGAATHDAAWWTSRKRLANAAWKVAEWCVLYDIPVRYMDVAALMGAGTNPGKGNGGITFHMWVTAAFHQSTHTDPGPGFPQVTFLALVHQAYDTQKGGDDMPDPRLSDEAVAFMNGVTAGLTAAEASSRGAHLAGFEKGTKAAEDGSPRPAAGNWQKDGWDVHTAANP